MSLSELEYASNACECEKKNNEYEEKVKKIWKKK